jgi:hypothetical protein
VLSRRLAGFAGMAANAVKRRIAIQGHIIVGKQGHAI